MMTGKRILLIEDHESSCAALCGMIERRNGTAECAQSLKEGIIVERLARQAGNPFDCIISDMGLPNCAAADVIDALKTFESYGIPVRAITGSHDPELLAACQAAGVRVILKATHAEGIIESILYALAEKKGADPREVAEAVLENREHVREVPAHTAWFFLTWPKWVQAAGSIGTFIGVCTTITAMCFAAVQRIDAKAIAREAALHATETFKEAAEANRLQVQKNNERITSLETFRTQILTRLESLPRIEEKLDAVLVTKAKVDAMWSQRMEGKSNNQMTNQGDTPSGPAPTPRK